MHEVGLVVAGVCIGWSLRGLAQLLSPRPPRRRTRARATSTVDWSRVDTRGLGSGIVPGRPDAPRPPDDPATPEWPDLTV